MWDVIDEALAEKQGKKKGEVRDHYVKELTALGRVSVPDDVAKLVSFLASPDRYVACFWPPRRRYTMSKFYA